MDRGRIGCAAAPTFSSDRAGGTLPAVKHKPRVRVSRFPVPDTREQALASLATMLDQHEEDADALDALHSLDALDSLDSLDEEQC